MQNRNIDTVIILGCGESILSLSEDEKNYINQCKYVIGINKFMAFYDISGIIPNYVYFHDELDNAVLMFKYIVNKCNSDKLKGVTFFTNWRFKMLTSKLWLPYFIYLKIRSFIKWNVLKNKTWRADKVYIGMPLKRITPPVASKIISVKLSTYDSGGMWAKTLSDKLFNYKGSLSSILNICSIIAPNVPIYLVGNDFNGSKYFFQEKLKELQFDSTDYTSEIVKREHRHMSFIPTNGGKTFSDQLPFIIKNLKRNGNELFCVNPDSLLVTEGHVEYKRLPI